jgi:hypothetical protein
MYVRRPHRRDHTIEILQRARNQLSQIKSCTFPECAGGPRIYDPEREYERECECECECLPAILEEVTVCQTSTLQFSVFLTYPQLSKIDLH